MIYSFLLIIQGTDMKETFSIKEVALMTGLSTRTIRNYISAGFLEGSKQDGAWVFNSDQLEKFIHNNAVKPAIRAKKNAIVYDFMSTKRRDIDKICIILDMNSKKAIEATTFFCKNISSVEPETEMRFSSDSIDNSVRIILSGSTKDVMDLLNRYYSEK